MLFISYSRAEFRETKSLVQHLSAKRLEWWLDESNIPVGQAFVVQLGAALRNSTCFLLVDTAASRNSYWVLRDVKAAIRYRSEHLLRVYDKACAREIATRWDASVPLDSDAYQRIAELLASRSTLPNLTGTDREVSDISNRPYMRSPVR